MFFGQIIGNLGRDAQLRDGNRGKYVTFSVADTRKYKDAKGQQVEQTTWVSCTLNNDGGALLPYLLKGQKVYCSGPLSLRMYRNQQGQMEAGINLSVREIELCGSSPTRPMQQQQQPSDFAVNAAAGAPPAPMSQPAPPAAQAAPPASVAPITANAPQAPAAPAQTEASYEGSWYDPFAGANCPPPVW